MGGGIANTLSNGFFENTVWKNGREVLFKSLRASKTLTRSLLRLRCCLLVANNPSLRPRYVASLNLRIAFLNDQFLINFLINFYYGSSSRQQQTNAYPIRLHIIVMAFSSTGNVGIRLNSIENNLISLHQAVEEGLKK